jgi:RND family efflux transporter MFP subunit
MIRKYILPILALLGVLHAIRVVALGNNPPPIQQPIGEPAASPFSSSVAGAGIIEAASENISIASPIAGVVEQVFVTVGQTVAAGDPLFLVDERALKAELAIRSANLKAAQAELNDARRELVLYQKITDKRAVSEDAMNKRRTAVEVASARLEQANASVEATKTDLERSMVRAPIAGQVLQVKIRKGEFAPAQALTTPLMVLGDTNTLHVRVDIDENDAWRVAVGMPAKASLRGNPSISVPLTFVRFEPFVIPKRSLTGESSERVDTRVLQAIYRMAERNPPLFVGQLMDVFIQAGNPTSPPTQ